MSGSTHLVQKLLSMKQTHIHQTYCSTWTTKVVGNKPSNFRTGTCKRCWLGAAGTVKGLTSWHRAIWPSCRAGASPHRRHFLRNCRPIRRWCLCTHVSHCWTPTNCTDKMKWVSRYQKGKTNLDFTKARDSEWQWHQLGHMQVCISLQTDTMPVPHHSRFFTGRMPFLPPNQQRQSTEGLPSPW